MVAGASHPGSASSSAGEAASNEKDRQGLRLRLRHPDGQTSPTTAYFLGTSVQNGTLAGGDLNLAFRLVGKGADGLYLNAGTGVRSYRQDVETSPRGKWTFSDTNISFNGGLGYSSGWFFTEANVVYFKVQNSDFVSIPLTVGFQF